jgi:UDP-N-acetylglucosamine 2-epimerase (non-hydrolysing)
MKILSLFGTRPEMIKLWPVLKKLDQLPLEHIMVHTGQNYTKELKDFFFRDLKLRQPDYELEIDVSNYGNEISDVVKKSYELFKKVQPDALLVLGDTYSGLAVLPASNLGIKIFHMEAGLRAWDKRMPEQRNRILIDHISDVLLPFSTYHRENLIKENIHPSKIFVTGNPTFETMREFQPDIARSNILEKLNLAPRDYFSVTLHRKENVDDPEALTAVIEALSQLQKEFNKKVVFSVHPRTKSKIKELNLPSNIQYIDPLGYYDFNALSMNAFCLLGDSGTTPEEGLFYKVPCVSLRWTSERYETLEAGAHIVAGLRSDEIVGSVKALTTLPWNARYDFEESHSASNVVVNVIHSHIKNFF